MTDQERVTISLTREQAEAVRRVADGVAADYTRLVMYPFTPDAETQANLRLWEGIFTAINDAIAEQLREAGSE